MADSALEQFLIAAAERAERAAVGAKRAAQGSSEPAKVRRGVILVVTGNVYTVGLIGTSDQVLGNIPGVRPWAGGLFSAGDRVWLAWEGSRPMPWIVGGSGGGGDGVYIVTGGLGFAS